MATELMLAPQRGVISSFEDASLAAKAMAGSGYFQDAKDASQALVKILAGQEVGLGPFASMTGIHIIQGRPAIGANLLATMIKNDPRYNYRVTEHTDKVCKITFYEGGQPCGVSEFTAEDARKAGTKNMDKFPRNMLFARAISNGARWYTPGIFGGAPVYTPEELGADVDEDGNVIAGSFAVIEPAAPAPNGNGHQEGVSVKALNAWVAVVGQAEELGLTVPAVDIEAMTDDDLRPIYGELKAAVKAAQA
jgi:hypothetical protein